MVPCFAGSLQYICCGVSNSTRTSFLEAFYGRELGPELELIGITQVFFQYSRLCISSHDHNIHKPAAALCVYVNGPGLCIYIYSIMRPGLCPIHVRSCAQRVRCVCARVCLRVCVCVCVCVCVGEWLDVVWCDRLRSCCNVLHYYR